ncbi:MAG TPA: tetratricopeptide repeat protein [Anaeromyxobacteraceae bacterium]|nr:tetratricopeptide repeat protein [Anaeromyxobacteraceae bacterium]
MRHSVLVIAVLAAALGCAHGASKKQRQAAEIHHDLAVEALRAGRVQEALKEFEAALASNERFPEAHRGLGLVLDHGFGRAADAERAYRRALELRPDYPEAHNDLATLLARAGRLDEALAHFDGALANMMYREPWVARCNKGQALYRAGRHAEGLSEMKSCVAANPRFCAGHRELGRIHLDEGRVKEALESFGAYARHCEGTADAHWLLGLARMKTGDVVEARAAFARCEELGGGTAVGEECRRSRELLQ